MNVPVAIQKRVTAKLQSGIDTLNKHYKLQLTMPRVTYKLRGATAGKADYRAWHIMLNAVLLMQNLDDFIARTVPHELAHLGTDKVYPDAHASRIVWTRAGRPKRAKRELHGSRWQEVMRVLGVQDSTRCHKYNVTDVKRKKARYEYRCTGCQSILSMGPKLHAQLGRNPASRWHRGCKGRRLELVGHQAAQSAPAYANPGAPKAKAAKAPRAGTQLAKAYKLYKDWHNQYDRKGMIAVFRNELGMTEAGSSTYVYQCQKLYQQGVL